MLGDDAVAMLLGSHRLSRELLLSARVMNHARVSEGVAKSQFPHQDSGFQKWRPRICAALKVLTPFTTPAWKVGIKLPEKGNSNMVQGRSTKIVSMIKWIRTRRLSIKNSRSAGEGVSAEENNLPALHSQGFSIVT